MTPERLHEIVVQLPMDQVHALVQPYPAAKRATPLEAATDLAVLARSDPVVMAAVEARLHAWGHPLRLDPVARWQQDMLEDARHVAMVGFHDKAKVRMELARIFVPLGFGGPEGLRGGELGGGRAGDCPGADGADIRVEQALAWVERTGRRRGKGLAVVGLPGSGKTTLLKHLYVDVRLHGSASVGLADGLVPVLLRAADLLQGLPEGDPPAVRDWLRARTLEDVLESAAARRGSRMKGAGNALAGTPLLVLIDALDEVGGEAALQHACDWLDHHLPRLGEHRWVLTSRHAAWDATRGAARSVFDTVHVRDFDAAGVRRYVEAWFEAVAGVDRTVDPAVNRARRDQLLAALEDPGRAAPGRLREMVGNPLMASLLCLVQWKVGHLPRTRAQLYEECLGVLLSAWAEAKQMAEGSRRPGVDVDGALRVLAPLAWGMQARQTQPEAVTVSAADVQAAVLQVLPRVAAFKGWSAAEFVRQASEECGVLLSPDLKRHRFVHLSFQEYLAALHAELRTDRGAAELAAVAHEPQWREPALLLLGRDRVTTPFFRAVLARPDVLDHVELWRELYQEAPVQEAEALLDAVAAGGAGARAALRIGPPELLREACRAHVDSEDLLLRADARRLLGLDEHAWRRLTRSFGGVPMDFVWVPAGAFSREGVRIRIHPGFWLGRHPVTVAQYRAFVKATRREEPPSFRDASLRGDDLPVTVVTWDDAVAFGAWASGPEGVVSLPTEAEWEYAARGDSSRRYPWGDEPPTRERAWWVAALGAVDEYGFEMSPAEAEQPRPKGPAAVGERPAGASMFCGAEDLAGNVWEWSRDQWRTPYAKDTDNPCHDPAESVTQAPRVLRGGAWVDPSRLLRCASRLRYLPQLRFPGLGFRVVFRPSSPVDP